MKAPDEFSFYQLRAFHELVRTQSFSKAARALGLSQPTISQHIANLEEVLGTQLIDRRRRSITLTEGGRTFLRYAEQLFELRDRAAKAVQSVTGRVTGPITVGASTIPGTYIVPRLLGDFQRTYPSVAVTVLVSDTDSVLEGVRSGSMDVGLVGAQPRDKRLRSRRCAKDEIVLACPLSHAFARRRTVAPAALLSEPFIWREEGSGTQQHVEKALKSAGVRLGDLHAVCTLGSTEAVKQAVIQGVGLAFISDQALTGNPDADGVGTVAVRGLRMNREFYIAILPSSLDHQAPGAFFRHVVKQKS